MWVYANRNQELLAEPFTIRLFVANGPPKGFGSSTTDEIIDILRGAF
jgi:hypothetical protein